MNTKTTKIFKQHRFAHCLKSLSLIAVMLLSIVSVAKADDVTFTAKAPRAVEVGEQFRLQFVLNAKGSNFEAPAITDFAVLSGPNSSSSTSMQWINGKMSQSVTYTLSFILMAEKAGVFTIPAARIKSDGKVYTSQPITIEVVQGANTASQQSQTQSQSGQSSSVSDPSLSKDDLFVAISVDKKNLYQGQYLVATIKLYTKRDVSGFDNVKFPAFTGFWSHELEAPQQIMLQRENVNGQLYNTGLLKKVLLMPQRSGELEIEPMQIDILTRTRHSTGDPFEDFFGGGYKTIQNKLASKPVKINVEPLPAGKPADFTGGVGNFTISANIDKQIVKTNEPVTLRVKVSGSGNLKFINNIKVDFPPDIDVYDPKTVQNIKTSATGMSGTVTFEYLFIPRYAGNYRIAPITFSYFDTNSKSYKTLKTSEFVVDVEKGENEGETSAGVVQTLTKEDVKFIGKDIRYIKPISKLEKKSNFIYGQTWFFGSYLLALLVFVAIIVFRMAQIKQNANQAVVKNRKANKVSKKRLRLVAKYMKQGNETLFYEEILKAIWGYLSDKLSIPIANLSKDNVSGILAEHSIDNQLIDELIDVLNSCEFARYAPSAISGGMEEIYGKVENVISKLDQKIK